MALGNKGTFLNYITSLQIIITALHNWLLLLIESLSVFVVKIKQELKRSTEYYSN